MKRAEQDEEEMKETIKEETKQKIIEKGIIESWRKQ